MWTSPVVRGSPRSHRAAAQSRGAQLLADKAKVHILDAYNPYSSPRLPAVATVLMVELAELGSRSVQRPLDDPSGCGVGRVIALAEILRPHANRFCFPGIGWFYLCLVRRPSCGAALRERTILPNSLLFFSEVDFKSGKTCRSWGLSA